MSDQFKSLRRAPMQHVTITHGFDETAQGLITQLIEAVKSSGGSINDLPAQVGFIREELSIVHGMIFDLTGKVQQLMASQEERLQAVQGQLSSIADGINTLQQQLADLKANNPALDDEISNIEATVKAIGEDLNPPAPTPVEG